MGTDNETDVLQTMDVLQFPSRVAVGLAITSSGRNIRKRLFLHTWLRMRISRSMKGYSILWDEHIRISLPREW